MLHLWPRQLAYRRVRRSDRNKSARGDIRIAEQIVVKILTAATELSEEIPKLAFRCIQPSEVDGISAVTAADRRQIVEQPILFSRERMHFESLIQHARSGMHIDHCVVH